MSKPYSARKRSTFSLPIFSHKRRTSSVPSVGGKPSFWARLRVEMLLRFLEEDRGAERDEEDEAGGLTEALLDDEREDERAEERAEDLEDDFEVLEEEGFEEEWVGSLYPIVCCGV
eukprot:GFKZ01012479.1.p2 GENE.GFKZ01012479.1~~GFKZ01012479.1.p2  ORF type:complete len:116 (+),score=24.96 GFKZ01012479.1:273-620(+)